MRAPITTRIRQTIWVKILGNVAFNPISALTGATLVQMARDPEVGSLIRKIMEETEAVGARLGLELPITIDQRIAVLDATERVHPHEAAQFIAAE